MPDITHILNNVAKGDRKAMEVLYKYCFERLMPVAFYYKLSEEEGRELFNTSFMKIIKKINTVRDKSQGFDPWARRIMANTILDELRKSKRLREHVANDVEITDRLDSESVVNQGERDLHYNELFELLKVLPDVTRQVFILYTIEGYKHQEIAEKLDIPVGTSKWHVNTAKKKLQPLVKEYYDEKLFTI